VKHKRTSRNRTTERRKRHRESSPIPVQERKHVYRLKGLGANGATEYVSVRADTPGEALAKAASHHGPEWTWSVRPQR